MSECLCHFFVRLQGLEELRAILKEIIGLTKVETTNLNAYTVLMAKAVDVQRTLKRKLTVGKSIVKSGKMGKRCPWTPNKKCRHEGCPASGLVLHNLWLDCA